MTFHTEERNTLHLVVYDATGTVAAACPSIYDAEILAHAGKYLPLFHAALVEAQQALKYFATGASNDHVTTMTARAALTTITTITDLGIQ